MATELCETSLETVNFIGINDTEEKISKWMKFCKSVHVHRCNATSMGISRHHYNSMIKHASHHDCFSHMDSETVYWLSIILSIVIIIANSFVIVIFSKNQHLHTINNIPLFSLAISDFIIGIIFLYSAIWSLLLVYAQYNFDVHRHFVYNTIRSNYYLCLTFEGPVLIFISLMSSILTLLLIASERYIAVIHTYKYNVIITKNRIVGSVIALWVISIGIGILPITGWNTYNGICAMNELLSSSYIFMWSCVCFISAAAMLVMYIRVFYVANRHRNQIHALHQSVGWNLPKEPQNPDDAVSITSSISTDLTDLENREIEVMDSSADALSNTTRSNSIQPNSEIATKISAPIQIFVKMYQAENPQQNNITNKMADVENSSLFANKLNVHQTEDSRSQKRPKDLSQTSKLQVPETKNQRRNSEERKTPSPYQSRRGLRFQPKQTQPIKKEDSMSKQTQPIKKHFDSKSKQTQPITIQRDSKLSQKAIKTTGLIIGLFYLCWLPFLTYIILYSLDYCSDKEVLYYLAVVTQLNSLINPIVYGYRQTDIKMAGSKILRLSKQKCFQENCQK